VEVLSVSRRRGSGPRHRVAVAGFVEQLSSLCDIVREARCVFRVGPRHRRHDSGRATGQSATQVLDDRVRIHGKADGSPDPEIGQHRIPEIHADVGVISARPGRHGQTRLFAQSVDQIRRQVVDDDVDAAVPQFQSRIVSSGTTLKSRPALAGAPP
jgi:hypothetical protein